MIDLQEQQHIIRETLQKIDMWKLRWENLLLYTGMVESGFREVIQGYTNKGTARSFWQVEPNTAKDNILNFIDFNPALESKIEKACGIKPLPKDKDRLKWILTVNEAFAICMAIIWYHRITIVTNKRIPDDKEGLAKFWKQYYNTNQGAGTKEDFINAIEKTCKFLEN